MSITDLIPWKKNETSVPIRHEREDDALLDLRTQMNNLFDEFFERPFGLSPFFSDSTFTGDFAPRLDISETDKEITISAELPGVEPDDLNISLDRNILSIRGEKHAEKEESGKRFYRVERSYGSFHHSIPLPKEVDENKIDATFKRGVLTVRLPKIRAAQEKNKRITIKTG